MRLLCREDGTFAAVAQWPVCLQGGWRGGTTRVTDVECQEPPSIPSSGEYLEERDRGRVVITTLNTSFVLTESNTSEAGVGVGNQQLWSCCFYSTTFPEVQTRDFLWWQNFLSLFSMHCIL